MIRKLWLFLEFMMSQTGQQIIAVNILPNISRCEGSETVKFS